MGELYELRRGTNTISFFLSLHAVIVIACQPLPFMSVISVLFQINYPSPVPKEPNNFHANLIWLNRLTESLGWL